MKAREIAEFVGGELRGDGEIEITSVADLENAGNLKLFFQLLHAA